MAQSMTTISCTLCEKPFSRRTAQVKYDLTHGRTRFFCGSECRNKAKIIRNVDRRCLYCKKIFRRKRSGGHDKGLVCSRSCGAKRAIELRWRDKPAAMWCQCGRRKVPRNPRCSSCEKTRRFSVTLGELRNEYSTALFHAKIRGLARAAFRGKMACAACGYDLHVDICHVRPVADFPSTATIAEVNDDDNLMALDKRCHWEFDNGYLHRDIDGTWHNT